MTEPGNKRNADELVREILADRDDDVEELLAMSPEEVERELVAGGFDLDKVKKDTARQLARIRAAGGSASDRSRAGPSAGDRSRAEPEERTAPDPATGHAHAERAAL